MSKDAPDAPDYRGAAEATAAGSRNVNEQQTWANRPTTNTPLSQQTWETTPTWDPVTGQYINSWTQNTNLVQPAQDALDSQLQTNATRSQTAQRLSGQLGQYDTPFSFGGYGDVNSGPQAQTYDSADKYYDNAGNAIYDQWATRQEPLMTRQSGELETKLRNQGLNPGDQAYDNAMRDENNRQTDARRMASYQATIGAGAEADRMLGMDLGAGQQNFSQANTQASNENMARQTRISEALRERGMPLEEINALLGGQQVDIPGTSFSAAGASAAPNYMNAANAQNQANLQQFGIQQANTNSMIQGAASLAAMFL